MRTNSGFSIVDEAEARRPLSLDFTGRVALVSGGASGIGTAIAQQLAAAGAEVAIFDVADGGASDGIRRYRGDVTDSAQVREAVDRLVADAGRLDVLVCSAGIPGRALRTTDVTDDEWRRVMATNADGAFYMCRAAIPHMVAQGYGRIVNVASVAAQVGNPALAAYSASKGAVISMTRSIAKDLATTGVLVNAIVPAAIATPLVEDIPDDELATMVDSIPLGRIGTAREVADLALFLASEHMSFATGACFDVTGGRAIR